MKNGRSRDRHPPVGNNFTLTRRSLLESMLGIGGVAGMTSAWRLVALGRGAQQNGATRSVSRPSLSRQFARWVAALRYEDLPAVVIDRAKGLTLQAVASALLGSQLPAGQQAMKFISE